MTKFKFQSLFESLCEKQQERQEQIQKLYEERIKWWNEILFEKLQILYLKQLEIYLQQAGLKERDNSNTFNEDYFKEIWFKKFNEILKEIQKVDANVSFHINSFSSIDLLKIPKREQVLNILNEIENEIYKECVNNDEENKEIEQTWKEVKYFINKLSNNNLKQLQQQEEEEEEDGSKLIQQEEEEKDISRSFNLQNLKKNGIEMFGILQENLSNKVKSKFKLKVKRYIYKSCIEIFRKKYNYKNYLNLQKENDNLLECFFKDNIVKQLSSTLRKKIEFIDWLFSKSLLNKHYNESNKYKNDKKRRTCFSFMKQLYIYENNNSLLKNYEKIILEILFDNKENLFNNDSLIIQSFIKIDDFSSIIKLYYFNELLLNNLTLQRIECIQIWIGESNEDLINNNYNINENIIIDFCIFKQFLLSIYHLLKEKFKLFKENIYKIFEDCIKYSFQRIIEISKLNSLNKNSNEESIMNFITIWVDLLTEVCNKIQDLEFNESTRISSNLIAMKHLINHSLMSLQLIL
ncbi:hypothetical protein ABK040_016178 [Willaertia magna]